MTETTPRPHHRGYVVRRRAGGAPTNDRGLSYRTWRTLATHSLPTPPRGASWEQLLFQAWIRSEDPGAWKRGFLQYQRAKARLDAQETAPF